MTECSESSSKQASTVVLTEHERDLAQNALLEFQKKSYTTCLTYLNKLELLRPKDLQVIHNKIVVEYYKCDFKKTELARKTLNAVCGNPVLTDAPQDTSEDVEKCVIRYNQAVLHYHTRQYEAALQILNRLFTFVEAMEENLAWKVCLLLIELYIQTNRLDATLSLINYVESQFICSSETIKSSSSGDNLNPTKTASVSKETKIQKKDNTDSQNDLFRIKLLKYKARIYLLLRQPKLCQKEWDTMLLVGAPQTTSTIFLKAHYEYVLGNYDKSIKLLNSATDNLDYKLCGGSAAVIYYNNMACINYSRSKPNLAAFYLEKALEENKKSIESIRGKETDKDPLSSQPVYTLGGDKHHELMFSLGISLLQAGQATRAFDCFLEAAQRLQNNPILWLKLAECCVYCHKPTNEVDFDVIKFRDCLVQKVIGNGNNKKIILSSGLNTDTKYHCESLSYAIPQPTIEFAMLCLKNALFALPKKENMQCPSSSLSGLPFNSSVNLSSGNTTPPCGIVSTHPSMSIIPITSHATWIEVMNLKIAILAASSYVSLCLGDYTVAFEHAKTLLKIEKIPGAYKLLGNLYAAECLILMDKINDAIDYLNIQDLFDLDLSIDMLDVDSEQNNDCNVNVFAFKHKWFPRSLRTANAVMRYNLAVAYAIRGELDKSGETLKQVYMSKGPDCDVPIHVIMLALYIELQLGN
ncbi:hypothetical protein HCN44_003400 [Aphidius gifuensis]|uniref:CCR4-NOT transcription complex subunit 10 n=1 Tax=Aphidius gifuensis TaxID=684658 RepID=A0A835CVF3_APHGI|nr:hypothetical protein HCN44_003400 [Aphidius gifuensis]